MHLPAHRPCDKKPASLGCDLIGVLSLLALCKFTSKALVDIGNRFGSCMGARSRPHLHASMVSVRRLKSCITSVQVNELSEGHRTTPVLDDYQNHESMHH